MGGRDYDSGVIYLYPSHRGVSDDDDGLAAGFQDTGDFGKKPDPYLRRIGGRYSGDGAAADSLLRRWGSAVQFVQGRGGCLEPAQLRCWKTGYCAARRKTHQARSVPTDAP